MIAFTQQVAIQNAEYGIRANVILPGLMDTPMAVDTRARATGKSRAEVAAERDAQRAAAPADGRRLGRGLCGAVPRLRRGELPTRSFWSAIWARIRKSAARRTGVRSPI